MDTITQALLGAVCSNVCARHKLGKRAARWGAVGGALPDLDFVALVGGPWAGMEHHRGITHSLWFGPVVGSLIGWILWRRYARLREREPDHADAELGGTDKLRWWMLAVAVAIFSHPLLDACTTYGTQIFAPFSSYRASCHAIGIIDPVYTVPLIIGLTMGRVDDYARKMKASAVALIFTTAYLFYGWWLNQSAIGLARASLEAQGITAAQVDAYPRVLQIFQRRLVARDGDRIHVGQVSMFAPRPIVWHTFEPALHPLVEQTRVTPEGKLFEWFAMAQTAARIEELGAETVVEVHDMRYGDIVEPELSMWGIRARYRDGALVAPVERFRRRRSGDLSAAFSRMMRDTFSPE